MKRAAIVLSPCESVKNNSWTLKNSSWIIFLNQFMNYSCRSHEVKIGHHEIMNFIHETQIQEHSWTMGFLWTILRTSLQWSECMNVHECSRRWVKQIMNVQECSWTNLRNVTAVVRVHEHSWKFKMMSETNHEWLWISWMKSINYTNNNI